ncbi:MAG: hypothetical protein KBF76_17625, partial [Verrucomicrobiales bacterium]|nr:hypothetical protein [Verrucomicrobiales bacterium]
MVPGLRPFPQPLLADGYYDETGIWIEDSSYTGSYDSGSYYTDAYDTGSGYYDPWTNPSWDTDTDSDGINDYEEVNGFSIEREENYLTPYTYEEYDPATD